MGTDRDYFLRRAEEEEAHANMALSEQAKDAHLRLAGTYRDCAENRGPRPPSDGPGRPRLTIL